MNRKYMLGILLLLTLSIFVIPTRADSVSLEPIEDTYVSSYWTEDDDNFGSSDYLYVGEGSWGELYRPFIKFNVPQTTKKVITATVKTYWYNWALESRIFLTMAAITSDWDENFLTWNNMPNLTLSTIDSEFIGDGEWFNADVLDFIPENGDFSIYFWGGDREYLMSDSREEGFLSKPPKLVIEYESESIFQQIDGFFMPIIVMAIGISVGILIYKKH